MSEKKELTAWHGALTVTVAVGILLGIAGLCGAFKVDPVKAAEAKAEIKRVDALQSGVLIGVAGQNNRIERFYDAEARMVCYVIGEHRSISCGTPGSTGISNLEKRR